MALLTTPMLEVTDNVDDDSGVSYEFPLTFSTDEVIVNDRIEYYWGV